MHPPLLLDPLTVAVHLPLVEIKEMLVETKEVRDNKLNQLMLLQTSLIIYYQISRSGSLY